MNVKIVTNNGQSFGGCATYCTHDEGANTQERVAWTKTLNLGTQNPEVAWRVMAATASNANDLKRQAGVGAGGRKSEGPVTHIVFSWAEGEIKDLTPEKQQQAVKEAISKLGKDTTNSKKVKNGYRFYGDECQAILVGHKDKAHPHVHVILNRVHPEHGRMLPTGNDQIKMSKWAEKYQKQHDNEHLTPQRTLNNEARARGEWVKYEGNLSRREFERAKKVSDLGEHKKRALIKQQGKRAWEINKQTRQQQQRHKEQWHKMEAQRKQKSSEIEASKKEQLTKVEKVRTADTAKAKKAVRDAFRDRHELLIHERRAEMADFAKREETQLGRMTNAVRSIDWKKLQKIHSAFSLIASSGSHFKSEKVRREAFEKSLQEKKDQVLKEQKAEEAKAARQEKAKADHAQQLAKEKQQHELAQLRGEFTTQRADSVRTNTLEQAKIKAQWKQHDRQRSEEWKELTAEYPAVQSPYQRPAADDVKPRDLISNKGQGTVEAARVLTDRQKRIAQQLQNQPEHEHGDREHNEGREQ